MASLILSNEYEYSTNLYVDADAGKLAKRLDGFPLALATAGAYLKQAAISFSDYLRLYETSWAKLQKTSPELSSYEDRTLYSTWQISFERIKQRNTLSAQLLRLWAYFDNQDLWFELLRHSDTEDPNGIQEHIEDELSFHGAMRVLSDHGLVEVEKPSLELVESQGYSIHGCLHSWTVHVLNQEWNYDLARIALKVVALHVSEKQANLPWLTTRRLLQHAARCSYIVLNGLVLDDGMAPAYFNLGYLFDGQSKLTEAAQMYERALQIREKVLGTEHMSTLNIVHNLGNLYADQGKLALAEQMYERALQGYKKALGAEHTLTLGTVHNLGALYADQGKLALAEQMYKQALRGYDKALGAEHTWTLSTVYNLGNLYGNQGKLAEAELMYEQALQGREKALGAEHTLTVETVSNLGLLYGKQGKLAKAELMYQRALQGVEKVLGAEHKSTLRIVNNLGKICYDRCYELVKKSALQKLRFRSVSMEDSDPTPDIIRLANLCIRYEFCRTTLLIFLCGVLRWINEDTLSLLAFSYGISDAIPQYNKVCDGCLCDISESTGCFSCKSCKDVDLCGLCFARYGVDELKDTMVTCQDHPFLDFSKTLPIEDLEQWLQELASDLKSRLLFREK
jgi:tetratricopeptide (TPR) repeat protein